MTKDCTESCLPKDYVFNKACNPDTNCGVNCFCGAYENFCEVDPGGGGEPDPTPTPGGGGGGGGGSCEGNRCYEDWAGQCCDPPGCPYTWDQGYYNTCGGGGGPEPPPVVCTWGNWSDCSGSPATRTRKDDCGNKDTETCKGDIYAKAVIIDKNDITCAAANASTTPAVPTEFSFSRTSPSNAKKTQIDSTPVFFNNVDGGDYTIQGTFSEDYILAAACWTREKNPPLSGQGRSTKLSKPRRNDVLRFTLGYTELGPWFQTDGGGDVYGGETIVSLMPPNATPARLFVLDGQSGEPGVLTHGDTYDVNTAWGDNGESMISSTRWVMNEAYSTSGFFQTLYRQFGAPTAYDVFPDFNAVAKPAVKATPYNLYKSMATAGNWVIADGESYVFLVDGDVTIKGTITIPGSGFLAFIATGSIIIDSSVGTAYTSTTPVVEGIYVADGTFQTGSSSTLGKERFVGRGMFIANSFLLQRDLETFVVNGNRTRAAELFIYNPRLLLSMPQEMMGVPYTWQEVAP